MIDYISAADGKINLHPKGGSSIISSNDVESLAHVLAKEGFGETFMMSSSMDFADEEGFAHYDDAKKLLFKAGDRALVMMGIDKEELV